MATDDERIAATVRGFGGEVVMTRATHPSGTDRIAEVAADLDCDVVVNVQGDFPFLEPDMVDRSDRAAAGDTRRADGDPQGADRAIAPSWTIRTS